MTASCADERRDPSWRRDDRGEGCAFSPTSNPSGSWWPTTEPQRRIAAAIETTILGSHPIHVTSGEEAVLWVGANDCAVCLLDYDLPGIDGLETLARIHLRKPNLPVIMLSGAASEQVAVAAFRARVADYVPKRPGFEQNVAQLVQQLIATAPRAANSPTALDGTGIPAGLAQLTYQNRLRVIGRQLDLYDYRAATILEVAGDFLVRGALSGSRTPEALEFLDQDFPQLRQNAYNARGEGERRRATSTLLPTGYEDFLRALGHRFDTQFAEAVTVTELDSFVAVGGVAKVDATGQTGLSPLQWLLRADDIAFMLDDAFRRRAPVAEPKRGSFLRRHEARGTRIILVPHYGPRGPGRLGGAARKKGWGRGCVRCETSRFFTESRAGNCLVRPPLGGDWPAPH